MKFPIALSEIERHTGFVNNNLYENKEETKKCTNINSKTICGQFDNADNDLIK